MGTDVKRVLFVEDDPVQRDILCIYLEREKISDVEAHFVENGLEALSLLQSVYFDGVVTDNSMPEMRGEQLIEAIRRHEIEWVQNLPIAMLSNDNIRDLEYLESEYQKVTVYSKADLAQGWVKISQIIYKLFGV
jgi:CheY-like chemotaxis protein